MIWVLIAAIDLGILAGVLSALRAPSPEDMQLCQAIAAVLILTRFEIEALRKEGKE